MSARTIAALDFPRTDALLVTVLSVAPAVVHVVSEPVRLEVPVVVVVVVVAMAVAVVVVAGECRGDHGSEHDQQHVLTTTQHQRQFS